MSKLRSRQITAKVLDVSELTCVHFDVPIEKLNELKMVHHLGPPGLRSPAGRILLS